MKLRAYILLFLLVFGLTPLVLAVMINLPLVLERTALFYQRAYLQNLRADFRDLDQHLASRHEMIRLLSKLPEPGLLLGEHDDADQIDLARARYTGWINQILADQLDIIQILFLGGDGLERFWLARDARTLEWRPTAQPPQLPSQGFVDAGLALQPGAVLVSRIRIDADAGGRDHRQLMTLNLASRIGAGRADDAQGVVLMGIDVGGLAQFYRDTLWVNQDGSYLRAGQPVSGQPEAFEAFAGLGGIFAEGKLALWKGPQGRQWLWVPMFLTEDGHPLWVGRAVDPSPLDDFRDALMVRVLSIIFVLVVVVMILARWIAARLEHFGQQLSAGVARILRDGEPLRFAWSGPREIRDLGEQLTALAHTHAEHLRAARAHTRELEKSNRYKSEFLANVSHELRTPLNSILLLSKMLGAEQGGLDTTQRRQAQVIHEAGRDLRGMIDNILDISRIEAGHVALALDWVELAPTLKELVELVEPQLAGKPVALTLHQDPQAQRWIHSDRGKLRQIVKNFLSNAVKFTEAGHIRLRLEASGDARRPVAVRVSDTGIGIPADKQDIIFEAFQQADGSTRRRYGGTGLGLSISRELATLLGGAIEVTSRPGAGSCFSLLLPVSATAESCDLPPPPDAPTLNLRPGLVESIDDDPPVPMAVADDAWVLIVERDVKTLVSLASMLTGVGVRVQTAVDLDEALETLQDAPGGCMLILLAERVLGAAACDSIESLLANARPSSPAIAVIGDDGSSLPWEACPHAGEVEYLKTPVDPRQLHVLIALARPAGASADV